MDKQLLKLTKRQKMVIDCLRNGYSLITNSDMKGATVGHINGDEFHIDGGVFFRLYNKGIIFQDSKQHFQYVLTELGKTINLK